MSTVNKTQVVHVVSEIVAFMTLTFYVNQKNKVLLKHIDDVSQRLSDTETLVKELNIEVKSLREELGRYRNLDVTIQPKQCGRPSRDTFVKPQVRKQVIETSPVERQTQRQVQSNDKQRRVSKTTPQIDDEKIVQRVEDTEEPEYESPDSQYYQKSDMDDEYQYDESKLDDELRDDLDALASELANRQPSTKESSTSSKKKQSRVLDQLD